MKSGRTFTLDIDVLMKKPTSDLVNRLLKEFYKAQGNGDCMHQWSGWCATASGLARECIVCHKTENKDAE